MSSKYPTLICALGLFVSILGGSLVYAQVRDTDIALKLTPESPGSNQEVSATLESFTTDLNKAYISWFVNNEELNGGVGKKVFYFTTGAIGSPANLMATINTVDGQNIQKKAVLTPTDLDLLWEAYDSYVPPFYKGKTLVGSQGTFKIVAIPNLINQNQKINAGNLSYLWTKDGDPQLNSSGWGKNYLALQNSYLDKVNDVKVKVSDIVGNISTTGNIQLSTTKPKIVFYEDDPLLGVLWERALNSGFKVDVKGKTLVAEPFFFLPRNTDSASLVFDWFLNGEKIQTPDSKNRLSVKTEAGRSGQALIKVMVDNVNTLFQNAEKEFSVEF